MGDYENFGLSEKFVKSILNQVLKEPRTQLPTSKFVKAVLEGSLPHEMMQIATGFSLKGKHEMVWFTPVHHWFANKLRDVYLRFAISNNLVGDSYEKDVRSFCDVYARGFDVSPTDSLFGLTIRPAQKSTEAKSDVIPRLIARRYDFTVQVGGQKYKGEIDFAIFSNNSLYLIEAKSVDMDDRRSVTYLRNEAAKQCFRYCEWIRTSDEYLDLSKIIGVSQDRIYSVRVAILSSGIYKDMVVRSAESEEKFSVIPEHVLFSIMVGIIPTPGKTIFPNIWVNALPAFQKIYPDLQRLYVPDTNPAFERTARQNIQSWIDLVLFDRRKNFSEFKAKELSSVLPPAQLIEHFIGDTTSWTLPRPVLIVLKDGWKYYVGTQISSIGSTYICRACKVAVKYYAGPKLDCRQRQCPKCGKPLKYEFVPEIARNMSEAVIQYRISKDKERYGEGIFKRR